MGTSRGVLAAAVVVACGGSPKPPVKQPAPKVVTYSPMGIKDDAKAPHQAVILGTDDKNGSTVLPLALAPSQVQVGGVALATAPNLDQNVHVSGDLAGVWASAMVAATTLDKDLTDFTFSATGAADAGSGLMAAGFLAAMTGATVDEHATVAGALDPDGTIVEPSGTVTDIHDAYKRLTGKDLPQPLPVSESDMALDKPTIDALEAKYKEWQQRVATNWSTLVQLDTAGRLPPVLAAMRDYAKTYAEAAEALHKHGNVGAAYSRMLAAWAFGSATTQAYDILSKVQSGNVAGAIDAIKALDRLDESTTSVLQKIGALHPTTLGEHLEMMAAFQAGLRSYAFKTMATPAIEATTAYLQSLSSLPTAELGSPETADKVMQTVAPTVLFVARTIAEATLASQELEFETAQSVPYTGSAVDVRRMALGFASAGAAGVAQVDKLLDIKTDEMRTRAAIAEPDYLVATIATKLGTGPLDDLKAGWGEQSLSWNLLQLAGSELAYDDAAGLIAKYGSLGAHVDDSGKVDKLDHDKAFTSLLAAADRNARAAARAARVATGSIPVQARLAYQLASVERDGDLGDKLDALSEFWAASAFSQTAVMLARN